MMDHERIKQIIAASVDGGLDDEARAVVEKHLASCAECRREYEGLKKVEEVMGKMAFKNPPHEIWDVYWASVYNRLERGAGWVLLSLGAIILLFFGAYKLVEGVIRAAAIPLLLKVGILAFMGGGIVLLVSIIREHVFLRKRERYEEIDQ
jgi:predicted anti-sigma-YlaC factor YlaD